MGTIFIASGDLCQRGLLDSVVETRAKKDELLLLLGYPDVIYLRLDSGNDEGVTRKRRRQGTGRSSDAHWT